MLSETTLRQSTQSGKGKRSPKTLEDDRGQYVLDVICRTGRDIEATLKKIVCNAQAAKVLRWCLLWSGKSTRCTGDTFTKTRPEWLEEAGVSESNLKTAVKHLQKFPWWKDECRGLPWGGRAQHYTVDVEAVLDEVLKVIKPHKLTLVKDEPEQVPEVKQTGEGSPVDSTGPLSSKATGPMQPNPPDQIGETDRIGPVDSTVSSMMAVFTSVNTPSSDSHSARAREAAVSPVQAREREDLPIDFQAGEREPERPASDVGLLPLGDAANGQLAQVPVKELGEGSPESDLERLIRAQRDIGILLVDARDQAVARELLKAGYAAEMLISCYQAVVFCEHQRVKSWNSVRSRIAEFAVAGELGCCRSRKRLSYATATPGVYAGRDSGPVIVVETEEQRSEHERMEQSRRERAEAEAARRAETAAARLRAENERVAERTGQLLEISDGRIEGVDQDDDLRSLDRLAREGKSIEQLRAAFDWFAENRGPGEPLGWSRVDYGWPRYMQFLRHPESQPASSARPAGRSMVGLRVLPRALVSDPVLNAIASVCGLEASQCSDLDYASLSEAQGGYLAMSRRLFAADRVAELERFGEWFGSKEGRAPAPMEIINRLSEFRGSYAQR